LTLSRLADPSIRSLLRRGYVALLVFMAGSVFVGMALAQLVQPNIFTP
jgi:hypothetical protein